MKKILYVQYTNPAAYPPLRHSSRILADEGWDVTFLGLRSRETDRIHLPPHKNIRVCCFDPSIPGLFQKIHYAFFVVRAFIWVLIRRPNWVYVSDILSVPLAALLSYWPGLRVIYHEHDTPPADGKRRRDRVLRFARRVTARRADLCILPQSQRLKEFLRETGRTGDSVCVWNCPAKSEVLPPRSAPCGTELRLYYQGSVGADRLPLSLLDAMILVKRPVSLHFAGYETAGAGYIKEFLDRAMSLGLQERVRYLGVLDRPELFLALATADLGVSFMPVKTTDINLRHMVGASNKAFDYLAGGAALLMSNLPDWIEMYGNGIYGVACDPEEPAAIARTLEDLLDNPGRLAEMGERGRRRILEDWNYETQFEPVHVVLRRSGPRAAGRD